jgi:hypothetical protein
MKYIKTLKDFTHLYCGTLILIKEGTLLEREILNEGKSFEESNYRPIGLKPNVYIKSFIVESNPDYFVEIHENEWLRESKYTKIIDYILTIDPYINWANFVETIKSRFCPDVISTEAINDMLEKLKGDLTKGTPIPAYPAYPGVIDTTRCPSCGNLAGSPCWNTACPYRIQVWYSNSSSATRLD